MKSLRILGIILLLTFTLTGCEITGDMGYDIRQALHQIGIDLPNKSGNKDRATNKIDIPSLTKDSTKKAEELLSGFATKTVRASTLEAIELAAAGYSDKLDEWLILLEDKVNTLPKDTRKDLYDATAAQIQILSEKIEEGKDGLPEDELEMRLKSLEFLNKLAQLLKS